MWKSCKDALQRWSLKVLFWIFPLPPDDNPFVDDAKLTEKVKEYRPPTPEEIAMAPAFAPPEGIDRKTGVSHVALAGGESIVPYVGSTGETSVSEKQLRRMTAPKTGKTCATCRGWGGMTGDCPDCGGKGSV